MENKVTLSEFVLEQITEFKIDNTKENLKKIRVKLTRELKKEGEWDKAEVKLIRSKYTKIFPRKVLDNLINKEKNIKYLIKNSKTISLEAYEKERENLIKEADEDNDPNNWVEISELLAEEADPYQLSYADINKITEETKQEALYKMVSVLFEKEYEPIKLKKWIDDKIEVKNIELKFTAEESLNIANYIAARARLKNPLNSYTQKKDK